jgi:endonuclease/exonuclease/phosphatase family metal-dependent hydrolase
MKRLFALLLLCLQALPSQAQEKEKAAEKETVRVLTFNLRYVNTQDTGWKAWSERRDAAAELIKKDAADFIGVQEALRVQIDDVKARVPGYGELGVGREDGKEKGEYSAILYREAAWTVTASGTFWLSDTPEVVASTTWGNKTTRVCTWGHFKHKVSGRELFVYNAHLDHQSQPSREKASALILQRIRDRKSNAPVIVTGDFNADPKNAAIAVMLKGPPVFTDAWLALNPNIAASEAGTFHAFGGKKEGGRIDYIFCSPEFEAVEASIMHDGKDGKFPSDHFPVRATLRLK